MFVTEFCRNNCKDLDEMGRMIEERLAKRADLVKHGGSSIVRWMRVTAEGVEGLRTGTICVISVDCSHCCTGN